MRSLTVPVSLSSLDLPWRSPCVVSSVAAGFSGFLGGSWLGADGAGGGVSGCWANDGSASSTASAKEETRANRKLFKSQSSARPGEVTDASWSILARQRLLTGSVT